MVVGSRQGGYFSEMKALRAAAEVLEPKLHCIFSLSSRR
jgi:hypothetical protein